MFKHLKAILYLVSVIWTIWLIVKSYGTECFSMFDSYITIMVLLGSMILNDLINKRENYELK